MKHATLNILLVIIILGLISTACTPTANSSFDGSEIQVLKVNEGEPSQNTIKQIKVFDQCQSASPLKAAISFNEVLSQESGEVLIIGGGVGVEAPIKQKAIVALQIGIQKHYSEKMTQSSSREESLNIEVPAHTRQQYEITWLEHRQQGSVDYTENGEDKSAEYSYRVGVGISSSVVIDLGCPVTITPDVASPTLVVTETTRSSETYLFSEDFQDRQHSFYSLVGNWTIQEDPYLLGNNIFQVDTTGTTKSEESSVTLIQSVPESFELELKVRFTQDNLVDRYFVSISWWENRNYVISAIQQQVYFVNRETAERFFEYGYNFTKNTWYTLKVEVNGNNAIFYLNGQKIGEVENLPSADTNPIDLGFVVGEKSGIVQFDDFYVIKTGQ